MTGRQVVHEREGTFWTPVRQRDALVVLLRFVTGAVDAIGFTRLGGVVTSVMTANMVLLGVSAGKGDVSLAIHTGVAFTAFVLGGLAGARVAGHATKDQDFWPRSILTALVLELSVLGLDRPGPRAQGRLAADRQLDRGRSADDHDERSHDRGRQTTDQ